MTIDELMKADADFCCGKCCWFKHEDIDGDGICYMHYAEDMTTGEFGPMKHCGSHACMDYTSVEEMRHHVAVLLQANRYRRDGNVPAIYRMPDPTELGKAIDFAVEYIKTFMKI
jgi:hypothetical protein